jgi:glycerol-3-phosphate dehydrogenase
MQTARLGPAERTRALERLTGQTFDVVVVGGGVTGAGTALDAATRGLSVALLEARDLAIGTSSRSGKTFHGGLRYLEQLNFKLVREAAHERNLMVGRLCPHLTRPTPFLYPLSKHVWERGYVGSGVLLYDLLGGARMAMPRHRHLTRSGVVRQIPAIDPDRITGGLQYYDVVVDDARHTMEVARTAATFGAVIATDLPVIGMVTEGGRVSGVRARDHDTGQEITVRGRCVISATGAWADLVQQLTGTSQLEVQPAKGVHVLVDRERIQASSGLLARTADSVLVVRPWGERFWLIGTTDTPWAFDRNDPTANASDVDYLLDEVAKWLRTPLTRDDVVGVYCGIRPLLKGKGGSGTAALSRDHAVLTEPPGLFTIVGGKYTTYRVMARDVVDAAASWLGGNIPPSVTETTPLLGAWGLDAVRNGRAALADRHGLPADQVDRLLGRYGSLVTELSELMGERPELARPIEGTPGYLEAEVVYAASSEGALHLDDILTRRTHVSIETRDRGQTAAKRVAELAGEVLGWDDARRAGEIARYEAQMEADRRAEREPTDEAAFAARRPILDTGG